jgi:rhodanese-related sulfurtransferase
MKISLIHRAQTICASLSIAAAIAATFSFAGCKSPAGTSEMSETSETSPPTTGTTNTVKEEVVQHPNANLSLAEFQAHVEARKDTILDARQPQDYRRGHVPGALNLSVYDFSIDYAQLAPILQSRTNDLVIVYCSSRWCDAAYELKTKLVAVGYKHVVMFPGGWSAWQDAMLPEERSN